MTTVCMVVDLGVGAAERHRESGAEKKLEKRLYTGSAVCYDYSMNTYTTEQCLEDALDALETALDCVQGAGLADDPRFRGYSLCQLEGKEAGWLGGPFLVDEIRAALEAVREEEEED